MTWPESPKLGQYVSSWVPGEDLFEDENFYVSRVKPKERFRNAATQIDETLTEANDRKLVFWVPVGNASNGNTNARPNGKFDSEAFSTWSYVTHYGDWTAPHGWVPGGFADVAHKNGVGVSGVASVPWGGISSEWSSGFSTLVGIEAEKVAKFLHYHGVDGLGYNSEFSTGSSFILSGLRALHETVHKYLTEKVTRWSRTSGTMEPTIMGRLLSIVVSVIITTIPSAMASISAPRFFSITIGIEYWEG